MKKITCLFVLLLCSFSFYAQEDNNDDKKSGNNSSEIIDFKMYPNPVVQGKLYITTRLKGPKNIQIFNILGKRVFSVNLMGRELNVAKLSAGIYILKATIGKQNVTRKLVIK